MSDNIPYDIQAEIIKRLPVRSLIQFRSVSKSWKSLIDSSDFITRYSCQQQRLLVRYYFPVDFERRYVSIVDDDTFPQQKVFVTIHPLVNMFEDNMIVGSSHGLLCVYGKYRKGHDSPVSGKEGVVIWNPSIRKAIGVVVPNVASEIYGTNLGFGVCPKTNDPKIVKITHITSDMENSIQVEVFTLSTGAWRSPYNTNLPRKSTQFYSLQVNLDWFLYWRATDTIAMDGGTRSYNLIISFDMTSEEFREVNLPDTLADQSSHNLSMSKLRESLVVLEYTEEANNLVTSIWMMGDGVLKSFTKLFTVNLNAPRVYVKGFRKSGVPIIEIVKQHRGPFFVSRLVVFEPYSKCINNLGISGFGRPSFVYPYTETLLLLDHPDSIIYDKGKRYISKWSEAF